MSDKDVMEQIACEWRCLSDMNKKKYKELAEKGMQSLIVEKAGYLLYKKSITKRTLKEEKLRPKKPCGVFVDFSNDERDKHSAYYKSIGFVNATNELRAKWNALDFRTKYNYTQRNAEKQVIYKQKLHSYEIAKQSGKLIEISKKKQHQPFLAFQKSNYQEMKKEYRDQNHTELMKTLGDIFKSGEQST